MLRLFEVAVLCAAIVLAEEPAYNGFTMEEWRVCASMHSEACGPSADPPGPCLRRDECVQVVCRPKLPGSCALDPSLKFCDGIMCEFIRRQLHSPLGRLSHQPYSPTP